MAINNAIILAAGVGSRLFPFTKDRPKCLIDLGGTTLLRFQLEQLMKADFKRVVIAVGGFADKVEEYVESLKIKGMEIQFEYNPFYYCSNNLISLWLLKPYLNDPFILLNGDIAFDSESLRKLARAQGFIDLGYRRSDDFDDDDMKVTIENDLIVQVSKEIPFSKANGESLGMIRFSKDGAAVLKETLMRLVRDKEYLNRFYLMAIQKMIDEGSRVSACDLTGGQWFELDFPKDLEILSANISKVK